MRTPNDMQPPRTDMLASDTNLTQKSKGFTKGGEGIRADIYLDDDTNGIPTTSVGIALGYKDKYGKVKLYE